MLENPQNQYNVVRIEHFQPPPTLPPIPQLASFTDGTMCKLCPTDWTYVCCENIDGLQPCKKKQREKYSFLAKDGVTAHLGRLIREDRRQGARYWMRFLITVITSLIPYKAFFLGGSAGTFRSETWCPRCFPVTICWKQSDVKWWRIPGSVGMCYTCHSNSSIRVRENSIYWYS
jgi:hypothetical protein